MRLHAPEAAYDGEVDVTDVMMQSGRAAKFAREYADAKNLTIPVDSLSFRLRTQRGQMKVFMIANGVKSESGESYEMPLADAALDTHMKALGCEKLSSEEFAALKRAADSIVPQDRIRYFLWKIGRIFHADEAQTFPCTDDELRNLAESCRLQAKEIYDASERASTSGGLLLQTALITKIIVTQWCADREIPAHDAKRIRDEVLARLGYAVTIILGAFNSNISGLDLI